MVDDKEVGNLFGDNGDGGGQGRRLTFQAWTWEADLASTQLTTAYSVAWGVGVINMMSMVLVMMVKSMGMLVIVISNLEAA